MKKLLLATIVLTACSKDKVSFDTAEDSRRQVRENVTQLSQEYRAASKLGDYDIMIRGDSTISRECPQGDGWATIDLVTKDRDPSKTIRLKCSTVSEGIGCMTEEDFKTKRYATEDGKCSTEFGYPLPKLVK
jgi:hypothetical protein